MDDKYVWTDPSSLETQDSQGEISGLADWIDYEDTAQSIAPDNLSQSINNKKNFKRWKKVIKVILAIDGVVLAILGIGGLVANSDFFVHFGFIFSSFEVFVLPYAVLVSGIILLVNQFRTKSMFTAKKYSISRLDSQSDINTSSISIVKILVIVLGIVIISILLAIVHCKLLEVLFGLR